MSTVTVKAKKKDKELYQLILKKDGDAKTLAKTAQYAIEIIQQALCTKHYTDVKYLSNGDNGITFQVKDKNQTPYVVKVQRASTSFIQEIQVMKTFSDYKLSVHLKDHCFVILDNVSPKPFGVVVMEKAHGVLQQLLRTELSLQQLHMIGNQLYNMLLRMSELGIGHNDLNLRNIAYVMHGKRIELKLIDFGWGSNKRCFLDVEVLGFGRGLFNVVNNEGATFLQVHYWPKLKTLLSPKMLSQLPHSTVRQDIQSKLDQLYMGIFYECMKQRFISVQPLKVDIPQHVLINLLLLAPCTRSQHFQPPENPCVNGLCSLRQSNSTIKFSEITDVSAVLWQHEQRLAKHFQAGAQSCDVHIAEENRFAGVMVFPFVIDGLLSSTQQYDAKQVWTELQRLLSDLKQKNMTYGDLGVHKIGYCKDRGTLHLIDFGQGAMTYVEGIDWLTLGNSLYEYDMKPLLPFWGSLTHQQIKDQLVGKLESYHMSRLIMDLNPQVINPQGSTKIVEGS
jgi:tRNA A-37 threonylcarbamoyl transferase component Bud32